MGADIQSKLKSFSSISLSKMNAAASFLDRIDTKYLLSLEEFESILGHLEEHFFILEIQEKSIFEYSSIYMDTEKYNFYTQHQSGEKTRTKVRTRHYIESNIAFFEYKQKQKKLTRKFRYQFDPKEHGKMSPESTKFFEGTYQSLYGTMPENIFPSIETKYNRLTFCSKKNDERLTVDFNIALSDIRNSGKTDITLKNLVIVESKSVSDGCLSHKIMQTEKIEKTSGCSKYALGLIYHGIVKDFSKFKGTLEKIKKISQI